MDLSEFRSAKVWVKVVYGHEPDPNAPPEDVPPSITVRVAYRPAALSDEDVEFLTTFETARLIEQKRLPDPPDRPPEENRAQRRARERAERRADATPPGRERYAMVDYITRLAVDWDLTYDGEPLPITKEAITTYIEPGLRVAIVVGMLGDYLDRPNRMISSPLYSGTTKENGQTGQMLASGQNGQAGNVVATSRGTI